MTDETPDQAVQRPPETAAGAKAAADKAAAARKMVAEQAARDQAEAAARAEAEHQAQAAAYSANHSEPAPAEYGCDCGTRIDAIEEKVALLGKILLAAVAGAAVIWFLRTPSEREREQVEA